ncbi:RecQ family ATP-dependent DNA helicase [Virgibacillus alimentarius]|uniref:ATP-dependent DNA helicase RecQ n=1 Tax=Virgibacillus alimentarius TaxID=698769 RepID=A0ABS4S4H5_9BACI|nr:MULTISPECIES: ATP-dependent DNA helicase RecQ [Virgibacillus]MBP2256405.1 ATP-dependent DNA helicase RecQ [Virgibacillus alimentarius]HLR66350.1 RecQ family ATP-dependent DNA helicase [Virgibacillus sp.]
MKQQNFLKANLKKHFNYSYFRTGQKEIILDIMKGKDVLGVLPTGSGKSLCYQLPAKLLNGTTIVVSPLISLMIDQVKQLKSMQFKEVVALNSFMEYEEREQVFNKLNSYKLIYVSPELLQNNELLTRLSQIEVSLFVIDEAHCISQWGHEFRPNYLKLHSIANALNEPPILALSATATENVQSDIIEALNRPNMIKHIYPMDRENITFCVREVSNEKDKQKRIIHFLSNHRVPTLIYFSSRQSTEIVAKEIARKLPQLRIAFYHGGMDQSERISIQQQFMNDQLDLICCTNAFGMGINKKNIRLVIHYHFPSQIESYIQEIGRAGRDGNASLSLLLFSKKDYYIPANLIQKELPTEAELREVFTQLAEIYKDGYQYPITEQHLEHVLQINEIQTRFLYFQFEKHGMIKNNTIIYEKGHWIQAYHKINQLRIKRLSFKEKKISEMIQWMQKDDCLRKHLYKSFQDTYTEPAFACCSNCGFKLSEWKPEQTIVSKKPPASWEEKLKELFLIGVDNETD